MNDLFANPVQWITGWGRLSPQKHEFEEAFRNGDLCPRCLAFSSTMLQNTSGDAQLLRLSETMQHPMVSTCQICQFFASRLPDQNRSQQAWAGLRSIWHTHNARDGGKDKHIPWFDTTVDGCVTLRLATRSGEERFQLHDIHFTVDYLRSYEAVEADSRQRYPEMVDFGLVKSWLDDCDKAHSRCASSPVAIDGLKVIDCASRAIVSAPENCAFVALSYVWGSPGQRHPVDAFAITVLPLPQTIEDSIKVTQCLGYKYLWIDRYCVPQHDTHVKDVQLQQMDAIYASAQVTLIAAAGIDPFYGLPGVSSKRSISHGRFGPMTFRLVPATCERMVADSVWNMRAWTYQEEILSRRKLYFTDHHVWLGCNEAQHCRDPLNSFFGAWSPSRIMTMNQTFLPYSGLGDAVAAIIKLQDLIKQYSKRQMSFESDALNAFTGILNKFRARYSSIRILWGLPVTSHSLDVHQDLLWMNWRSAEPRQRREEFPSWSWLGWRGATDFLPAPLCFRILPFAEQHPGHATDHRNYAAGSRQQEVGTVLQDQSKCITVAGIMAKFAITEVRWDHPSAWVLDGPHIVLPLHDGADAYFRIFWDTDNESLLTTPSMLGVAIVTDEQGPFWEELMVVLLQPRGGCYERVGLACSDDGGLAKRYAECPQGDEMLRLNPQKSFKDCTKTPAKDISWLHPSKRQTVCIH